VSKDKLRFDYCIEQYKLIIELDGMQHFAQVSSWQPPEYVQNRDKFKMNLALEHGYSIIRILQKDVWTNKKDWDTKLYSGILMVLHNTGPCISIFIGERYKTEYFTIDNAIYL
jgi:very-short-patch-repair endonuclease